MLGLILKQKLLPSTRYMFSLNPEINRSPFTVEEDCILMAAIKEYGCNYREFPSNLLPGRNMRQIRSRYNNVLKHVNVREHWSEQHDIRLMELVGIYGTSDWVKISEEMVSHTRTSCRQRYTTIKKFLEKHPTKTISDVPRRKRPFSTNVTTDNWMEAIIEVKNFESINTASEDECEPVTAKKSVRENSAGKPAIYNTPYYEFLKYSFNFKFGEIRVGSDETFENVQIACQLLNAPTLPIKMDIYDPWFSSYVTMQNCCKKMLESDITKSLVRFGRNDFLYPVHVNTIIGLRGLSAMFGPTIERKTSSEKTSNPSAIKPEPNTSQGHEALELFKSRFKSIFKQTAALAKMRRSFTQVALRLRNQKRKRAALPTATVTSSTAATTTDFHNNETLVRVAADDDENFVTYTMSETEEKPIKRNRITILESITVGMNELEEVGPLELPQPSVSGESYKYYRYRVEPSANVQETSIQSYVSESETEGMTDDQSTEFVIWTPTITDEATGSTTHGHLQCKKEK